jgi:hypothetical protein
VLISGAVRYSDKCRREIDIYADFLRFVDDEREREGRQVQLLLLLCHGYSPATPDTLFCMGLDFIHCRLFRRWCSLLKSLADPSIFRMNSGVTSVDSSGHGTFASDIPPKELLARAALASNESSVRTSSHADGPQSHGEKKGIEASTY